MRARRVGRGRMVWKIAPTEDSGWLVSKWCADARTPQPRSCQPVPAWLWCTQPRPRKARGARHFGGMMRQVS
eukprot:COSAG01_NODE_11468_length_1928_cov_1.982504_1_plen_72_part_00